MTELTSGIASPAPSTEQAPVTSEAPQQPTVPASDAPAADKPDVVSREDFRRLQATLTKQAQDAKMEAQRAQQEAYAMRQRLQQAETRDMPEDERRAYTMQQELEQLRMERQNYNAYVQQLQSDMQRQAILNEISTTTGVPVNELQDFATFDEAWRHGHKTALEREKKSLAAQQREQRRETAASVDLGGGATPSSLSEWEAAVEAAYNRGDARAYTRLLREQPS